MHHLWLFNSCQFVVPVRAEGSTAVCVAAVQDGWNERLHPGAKKKTGHHARFLLSNVVWSGEWDSNPRPSAWEADALPAELPPLVIGSVAPETGF